MRRFTFCLLCIFVFTIPWENSLMIDSVGTISKLCGIVLAVFGIYTIILKMMFRPPTKAHILIILFIMWAALSFYWSIDQQLTIDKLLSFIQLCAMVCFIWIFAPKVKDLDRLMLAFVLGGLLSCLLTVYNFIFNSDVFNETYRYSANNFNPNHLGIIIALSIVMSMQIEPKNVIMKLINFIYKPLAIFTVIITGSRTAAVIMASTMLMMFLLSNKKRFGQRILLVIILLISASIFFRYIPTLTLDRIFSTGIEITQGDLNGRLEIWSAAFQVFKDNSIIGVGFGAFDVSVVAITTDIIAAHNSFISVLVELGLIGLIIFIALLLLLIIYIFGIDTMYKKTMGILLLGWCLASSTGSWEHRKVTWFIFALIIGMYHKQQEDISLNSTRKSDLNMKIDTNR